MSRTLYFTVDVDRDCNIPVRGTSVAGSIDRGAGEAPRFSSSAEGLPIIADLLDDLGIRGTFFIEGRTAQTIDCSCLGGHCIGLHGYDHEDLTGKETGAVPDVREVLRRGFDAVSDAVSAPACFRAPYMSADPGVMEAVRGLGITADSSVYTDVGGPTAPYRSGGMTVYPVPKAKDRSGRTIAAYLWPMHEGKRRPEDYIEMASNLDHLVLATHSWHMTESREDGRMSPERAEENLRNVRRVLEGILDLGFRSDTVRPLRLRSPSSSASFRARTLLTGARILADRWNMTAKLILGKEVSEEIYGELRERIAALKAEGITPGLAVILVGADPASQVYVRKKGEMCESLGMASKTIIMPESTTQEELLAKVAELNRDPSVHGFLVQLPLPEHIDEEAVINAIDPAKDVDCFHPFNVGKMLIGNPDFLPATPAGVQQMLVRSGIETAGKNVVIVGRSNIVGKPMAAMMVQRGASADSTVTVVHSKTPDLASVTSKADILIVAIGKPRFITADMVADGAVVIDVGTNRVDDPSHPKGSRLVGDVDFEAVKEKASYITPVPGGVGPMTICMLMANAVKAAEKVKI